MAFHPTHRVTSAPYYSDTLGGRVEFRGEQEPAIGDLVEVVDATLDAVGDVFARFADGEEYYIALACLTALGDINDATISRSAIISVLVDQGLDRKRAEIVADAAERRTQTSTS
ncbi:MULTISPECIES: hypothetical protein [Bacteria]|uniref:hypothetical protein n=1 Tax=Bacteria TaxID=2 RepID=UPI003C7CB2B4